MSRLTTIKPVPRTNYLSHEMLNVLVWEGIGDIINTFRTRTLGLTTKLSNSIGPNVAHHLKIPHTYTFSPSLIPRPSDWEEHIEITGFLTLEEESVSYEPPQDLVDFLDLADADPVIYIGFGSMMMDDPEHVVQILIEATRTAGVRAVIASGWGGLMTTKTLDSSLVIEEDESRKESMRHDHVFFIESCPHDWLFPRVSAVVHHGGAGTLAAGLINKKPTIVIPFFGDQPFCKCNYFPTNIGFLTC
jgi:sterol 3beta-glucosyltransferase